MADERDDGAGRTEQPTPRRLEKAREAGEVVRAHGGAAAAVLIAGAVALGAFGAHFADRLELTLRLGLVADPHALGTPERFLAVAGRIIGPGLGVTASFLVFLAAVGFLADILVGGWVVSARPLVPDPSRINPLLGLKRLFSRTGGVEVVKALVKLLIVTAIAVLLLRDWADGFAQLAAAAWPQALRQAVLLLSRMFIILAAVLLVLAALEVPYQLWDHRDRLKMTRQEVRDELRELDGSPQTRRRIRTLRRRLARMRMMVEAAKADVVITNPDHYAAALSYSAGAMRAPRLVAKGTGLIALRIRAVAREHEVAIVEAAPLARAICRWVELGDEIPAALYPPVAEVLAYVHRLRIARASGRPAPAPQRQRFEPPPEFAA